MKLSQNTCSLTTQRKRRRCWKLCQRQCNFSGLSLHQKIIVRSWLEPKLDYLPPSLFFWLLYTIILYCCTQANYIISTENKSHISLHWGNERIRSSTVMGDGIFLHHKFEIFGFLSTVHRLITIQLFFAFHRSPCFSSLSFSMTSSPFVPFLLLFLLLWLHPCPIWLFILSPRSISLLLKHLNY